MRGYKLHISIGIVLIWFLSINCAWANERGITALSPSSEFPTEEEEWPEIDWNRELVEALMRINHPAIPKLRLNTETQRFEIKWVHGVDMDTWVLNSAKLTDEQFLKQVIDWIIEVGGALVLLHQAGFEHGDVNPSNVIIDERTNQPVLIDFDDYIAPDASIIRGLISVSMFSRILATDFPGKKIISIRESLQVFESIDRRFDSEIIALVDRSYFSVEEFVQKLKDYYARKWPIDPRAEAHLRASL